LPFSSEGLEAGIGLALSGGGFRATLFHCGALWRLSELGYLQRLARVSSVSGGSITAGQLALKWAALENARWAVDALRKEVARSRRGRPHCARRRIGAGVFRGKVNGCCGCWRAAVGRPRTPRAGSLARGV
jgi:NTE family protein